jgi:hypothetical protein
MRSGAHFMSAKKRKKATEARKKATTLVERLQARVDMLRGQLIELLASAPVGSLAVLRRRPAIEAEIWSCQAQLHAARNEHEDSVAANAEACRCQGEARRAAMLDAVERLERLEKVLGQGHELGEELRRLAGEGT